MNFNKCKRCGSFYLTGGEVCPKCAPKDKLEYSNFRNFVNKNGGMESPTEISCQTGISIKNINRYLGRNSSDNGNVNDTQINNMF